MENDIGKSGASVRGTVLALISAVAFGLLIPYAKLALEEMEPLQLGALLLLGAGIGVGCILAIRTAVGKTSPSSSLTKGDLPKALLIVVLNAAAVALLVLGLRSTLAANASLLMGFEIAAATVFSWMLSQRTVCYKAIAAVGIICIAAILLCWNVSGAIGLVPGSLLIALACIIRGFEGTVKKSLVDKDPLQIACIRSLGAGLVLLIASLAVDGMPTIAPPAVGNTAILGLLTFGLGAAMHLVSQRVLGSARAEGYFALAPFVGMLVSWALFGFTLDSLFFGSLALMALGVWLAMDDSVFHEDVFLAADRERLAEYSGDALAFSYDRMHRPMSR